MGPSIARLRRVKVHVFRSYSGLRNSDRHVTAVEGIETRL